MVIYICQRYSLSLSHPLLSPLCQSSLLYLSLYSYPANRFISTIFSRFHIYALIYNIYLFSFWFTSLHNNRLWVHPPHSDWLKLIPFYGWVIFRCVYAPWLLYPFIRRQASRLLPVPAAVNSAAMNTGLFQWCFSWSLLSCGTVGSCGRFTFSF